MGSCTSSSAPVEEPKPVSKDLVGMYFLISDTRKTVINSL